MKNKSLPCISMGPFKMFLGALLNHQSQYWMEKPTAFIVHPLVWFDLLLNTPVQEAVNIVEDKQGLRFYGVKVKIDCKCTAPKIVTCRNEIIEI